MKTGIKMRVTPEQSAKVWDIAIANGCREKDSLPDMIDHSYLYLYITVSGDISYGRMRAYFNMSSEEEVDADLFIRTNGTCEEEGQIIKKTEEFLDPCFAPPEYKQSETKTFKQRADEFINDFIKPPHYKNGTDTFARMRTNATFVEAMGFIKGNIDKYNWRDKGQDREDFEKIIAYAMEAIWWVDNKAQS